MHSTREIRRIGAGTLIVLAIIGLSATYWSLAGRDSILLRDDNPRQIEAIARIQRGKIYDTTEELLVESQQVSDIMIRRYRLPSTYSLVGYYSLRYGAGGAEAAFDELLNGSDQISSFQDFLSRRVFKIPQVGVDIRLTLSLRIQDALADLMQGHQGAAVVMDAQTGALLSLTSAPGFDPNSLDDDWERLSAADGKPFFNRALQGQYQPGNAMTTLWLAEAVKSEADFSKRYAGADSPIDLGEDTIVSCVIPPPRTDLTIVEAYIFGCPSPFLALRSSLPTESLADMLENFALHELITLPRFPSPEPQPAPAPANDDPVELESLARRDALGQGHVTITPLHLTVLMSAIANDGVVVSPYLLAGVREPGSASWSPVARSQESWPLMNAETALELKRALQQAWTTLRNESPLTEASVGAHVTMSRSGEGTQIWLNGFVDRSDQNAIAFVVLLENSADVSALLDMGQRLVNTLLS